MNTNDFPTLSLMFFYHSPSIRNPPNFNSTVSLHHEAYPQILRAYCNNPKHNLLRVYPIPSLTPSSKLILTIRHLFPTTYHLTGLSTRVIPDQTQRGGLAMSSPSRASRQTSRSPGRHTRSRPYNITESFRSPHTFLLARVPGSLPPLWGPRRTAKRMSLTHAFLFMTVQSYLFRRSPAAACWSNPC